MRFRLVGIWFVAGTPELIFYQVILIKLLTVLHLLLHNLTMQISKDEFKNNGRKILVYSVALLLYLYFFAVSVLKF